MINYSGSLVSAVENGQRPPSRDYVTAVDGALRTGGLFERLVSSLASADQSPVWFRDWLIIEQEATLLRWFEPLIVPGLLQTEAYARAIMSGAGLLDATEIEQRVVTRMERQRIIVGAKPPILIALIDEGVLRRSVGDSKIMSAQCDHLLEYVADASIQLHIVPASAGAHAGLAGPFILATGPDFEAAHLDSPWQAQIVGHKEAVDTLIRRWETIRSEALPRRQSIKLIEEVAKTWRT